MKLLGLSVGEKNQCCRLVFFPCMLHNALKGCRPRAVHAVQPLLGYPRLCPTFYKTNAYLLDTAAFRQCIIFLSETRIMRRGRLGSSAKSCPAFASVPRLKKYRVIGALPCRAKKGAGPTIQMSLSHRWRGQNDLFMYSPYYTLCAQHTSAPHPSPGRERRESVCVRPQQPGGAVFVCSFTGWPKRPVTSLPQTSRVYGLGSASVVRTECGCCQTAFEGWWWPW